MPESRGGGTSGGERWPSSSSACVRRGHDPSRRMEGAEEEEEGEAQGSSSSRPDNPDVDLEEQESRCFIINGKNPDRRSPVYDNFLYFVLSMNCILVQRSGVWDLAPSSGENADCSQLRHTSQSGKTCQ